MIGLRHPADGAINDVQFISTVGRGRMTLTVCFRSTALR
jgi:hypothetical protein